MFRNISNFVQFSCDNSTSSTCTSNVSQPQLNELLFEYPCSSTLNCYPYVIWMRPGKYLFKLWGAQGGDGKYFESPTIRKDSGGKGAYAEGILNIYSFSTMYLYIGGKGETHSSIEKGSFGRGGYNGGGTGAADPNDNTFPESSAGGGGATDIRLKHHSIGELDSLKSRIAVAAGGGGATSTDSYCTFDLNPNNPILCSYLRNECYMGGHAGALFGYTFNDVTPYPTQTSGLFGKGGNGVSISYNFGGSIGGSGGGFYGAPTLTSSDIPQNVQYVVGGSGGSSYISGFKGCNSVKEYPKDDVEPSGSPIHYSNMVFQDPILKSGLDTFFNQYHEEETGHSGSGSIIITYLGSPSIQTMTKNFKIHHFIIFVFIIIS